ncbi:MAG: hypothetical protein ACK5UP_10075, partial [Bacteroidota bacterium]
HPSVTVAALARRILSRRIPQNIVVERFSLNETPMKLRRFLAVIAEPSDVVAAVARMGLLEHAHMYSAVQGEAIALQMEKYWKKISKFFSGDIKLATPLQ